MSHRKRILLVIDSMEVGGSQRQIQKLIEGLDKHQWEPELAFFRVDSFLADEVRRLGIAVHHIPKRRRFDLRFLLAYAKLLRERRYALVHAFSLTAELWTIAARFMVDVKPVLVASERSSFRTDRPFWYWWIKRRIIASSAAVIANSQAGAESTARRVGIMDGRFTTIANAVDIPSPVSAPTRASMRQSFGVQDGRLLGLFVGRLVPVKNLACLVEALATMPAGRRPLVLLVGDGPLKQSLRELARQRGVQANVRFLGERKDVAQLMQVADFLVLPSRFEGQSNALLEAMAAGCPVIASAVGGNVELVQQGSTGLLFPDDESGALADCMEKMGDPALRARLSQAARANVVENFSQAALALETARVYQRCLEGTASPQWTMSRSGPPIKVK